MFFKNKTIYLQHFLQLPKSDAKIAYDIKFQYDGMNRLTNWDIYTNNTLVKQNGLTYNPTTSNIQTKTDVATGNLLYGENGKPHALTSIQLPLQGVGGLAD